MCLEELDLSKVSFENSSKCLREVGQVISKVTTLKSISLQKANLQDTETEEIIQSVA